MNSPIPNVLMSAASSVSFPLVKDTFLEFDAEESVRFRPLRLERASENRPPAALM